MPHDLFILTPRHEAAFALAGLNRFKIKAAKLLRKQFLSCEAKSDEALQTDIQRWMIAIRQKDILTETDMYRYFEAAVTLQEMGQDILRNGRIGSLLDSAADAESRSARILEEAKSQSKSRRSGK